MATSQYSIEQRVFLVEAYIRNKESPTATLRDYATHFKTKEVPSRPTLYNLIEKWRRTGSVHDDYAGHAGRMVTVRTEENISRVRELFQDQPNTSQRHASRQLGISRSSLRNIMKLDIGLFPYKIQLFHRLTDEDIARRMVFAQQMEDLIRENQIEIDKIWFSDEAHFQLDGYVNKQNYRFWGTENPQICVESTSYPERITVWAAISNQGIIGPFFNHQTISGKVYMDILENHFLPSARENGQIDRYWFMQDGATPHRTAAVFELLNQHFDDRVIGLGYRNRYDTGIDWPPSSPDLNPCDYFMWGYIKDVVYKKQYNTIEEVEQAIREAFWNIPIQHINSAILNFSNRLQVLQAINGAHIEQYHI